MERFTKGEKLEISLREINSIPPFSNQRLSAFFRTKRPIPLTSEQNLERYRIFCKFLLDRLSTKKLTYGTIPDSNNGKQPSTLKLILNHFYDKKFIREELGVGAYGGIRPNKNKNIVAVFFDSHPMRKINDYGRNVYEDYYDENTELYYYTGQGQKGDQKLMNTGNKWLFNSISNDEIKVLLFRQFHPTGRHKYLGQVKVIDYRDQIQTDADGTRRTVLIFTLKPTSTSFQFEESREIYEEIDEEIESANQTIPINKEKLELT
jgi:hypothetical protein